jgi:hypothetical protein
LKLRSTKFQVQWARDIELKLNLELPFYSVRALVANATFPEHADKLSSGVRNIEKSTIDCFRSCPPPGPYFFRHAAAAMRSEHRNMTLQVGTVAFA